MVFLCETTNLNFKIISKESGGEVIKFNYILWGWFATTLFVTGGHFIKKEDSMEKCLTI